MEILVSVAQNDKYNFKMLYPSKWLMCEMKSLDCKLKKKLEL